MREPCGLYSTKMLGSHFLTFLDNSALIKCEHLLRFMDDYIIFSDSKDILVKDFQTIQKILGQKSLNINSDKTVLFSEKNISISEEVDGMKSNIMERFSVGSGSGLDYEDYEEAVRELDESEVAYLISLLDEEKATDAEASLILDCIHEHSTNFSDYLPAFLLRFPHLSKKIYHKCGDVEDDDLESLAGVFVEKVKSEFALNEYQLFWIAKIAEKYFLSTTFAGELLSLLYEHKNATNISKAKILEIPEQRFGMPEWREIHLKNGTSGWLSWASAIGMRNETKQNRNYLMGYFSKISPMNALIADFITSQ